MNNPQVIHRKQNILPEIPYKNQFIIFDHDIDIFQHHAFNSIDANEITLVTAHTGSGKSLVAEYDIINTVKVLKKRAIYTSPIKTLSNQKYAEFQNHFKPYDISVGLMTGDNKINIDADCVIMTTEILRNILCSSSNVNNHYGMTLDNIGSVTMDEVHWIGDINRGKVWEYCLSTLSPDINLVLLSATIDNSQEFAEWICKIKNKNVNLITTLKRPVPLQHYVYAENNLYLIKDNDDNFFDNNYYEAVKASNLDQTIYNDYNGQHLLNNFIEFLRKKELMQTIFFILSREGCEKYASLITHTLIDSSDITEINHTFNHLFKNYEKTYGKLGQVTQVKNLLSKGIAFHHSGLIPILKEIIEILFQKGLVKILFATETFSSGINCPTRTVVFTSLTKPDDNGSKRYLLTPEYIQMAGRAGRRGKDIVGNCVILPLKENLPDITDMQQIMLGKGLNIESKFKLDYNFILKTLNSSNNIENVISNTLYFREINKNITYYEQQAQKKIEQMNQFEVFSENDIKKIKHFRALEYEYKNLKQKKPAKRKLFKSNMKKLYDDIELYNKYKKYDTYLNMLYDYENECRTIGELKNDINEQIENIKNYLERHQYLTYLNNTCNCKITNKGIMAANINESEPSLLLVEMINIKIFNGIEKCEDIAAIISIFLNGIRPDLYLGNFINNNDTELNLINEKFDIIEKILEIIEMDDYIDEIPYYYAEMCYRWVQGNNIQDTLENYNIYEGNFIHSMIKLNNIIIEIIKICKMNGYLDIIPKLESMEGLIMRDVVSITSLYL